MLKPVKNKKEYESALDRIYLLIQKGVKRTENEGNELEILTILVRDYEQKHIPIPPPHPLEAIKFRMEQMGLNPSELNKILGSRSRKSDVLNGKRKLSIQMIRKLHEKLNIPASTLIADY